MKIKINKFKRIQGLTIAVPAEITGGNGIGKTTILEAIAFCLTGKDLTGKEMAQVYDNRQDLHDAIADVSFFDNYGNEFRRKVQPTFETSRNGEERLKILRSTKCTKNKIDTNDFGAEFQDFFRFGTDYFFNQKEGDQRTIFIDLMKSLLPTFDVQEAQLKLKSLKKSQLDTVIEIKNIRAMVKELKNEESIAIPDSLQESEEEYQTLILSSLNNQALTAKINSENNSLIDAHRISKSHLEALLEGKEGALRRYQSEMKDVERRLGSVKDEALTMLAVDDLSELYEKAGAIREQLDGLRYFDDVREFGKLSATKNAIVTQNIEKIKALLNGEGDDTDVSDVCSACGVASPEARQKSLGIKIEAIKQENRDLLTIDMRASNNAYLTVKDDLERIAKNLNKAEAENVSILKDNEQKARSFKIDKTNRTESATKDIRENSAKIEVLTDEIAVIKVRISDLKEPILKSLPTELTISGELKIAHDKFSEMRDKNIGIAAINQNNQRTKTAKEVAIREYQSFLADLDIKVVKLQTEISAYFSNLGAIVAKEFEGKIEIGVQLLDYVITKDEYKDCFKITANGKIFPSECNGALANNVKLQVLRTLQRLKNYTGLTIIDNAEANTTQPLDGEGMALVAARATTDSDLSIKTI